MGKPEDPPPGFPISDDERTGEGARLSINLLLTLRWVQHAERAASVGPHQHERILTLRHAG